MLGLVVVLAAHARAVRVAGRQVRRGTVFVAAFARVGHYQGGGLLADLGDGLWRGDAGGWLALTWAAGAGDGLGAAAGVGRRRQEEGGGFFAHGGPCGVGRVSTLHAMCKQMAAS